MHSRGLRAGNRKSIILDMKLHDIEQEALGLGESERAELVLSLLRTLAELIHRPECSRSEALGTTAHPKGWVILTRKLVGDFARKLTSIAAALE
jgi:hypothetical protein